MITILIISHGNLGAEMLKTAELIIGKQDNAIVQVLLKNDSLSCISERIGNILDNINSSEGTLILTDILGGTPCNASLIFSQTHNIEVISGFNLYMLISAFMNRNKLCIADLAKKVLSDGYNNIVNAKEMFLNKLK